MTAPTRPPWAEAGAPEGPPVAASPWPVDADVVAPPPAGSPPATEASDEAPTWLRWLALLSLAALAAVTSLGWWVNDRAAETANRRADDVGFELDAATGRLQRAESRLDALDRAAASAPDLAETVATATPSVFTVATAYGNGSAWVARSDGGTSRLVTNYHVLEAAYVTGVREVDLRQAGRTLRGTVLQVAPDEDLALIEVPEALPALRLTTSGPRVGDPVTVVGSPLGLDQTVVTGIVSALRDGNIQMSAPISPGSSGGPVLNEAGEVLGVTEQKVVGNGAEGLAFAIPVATLCATVLAC